MPGFATCDAFRLHHASWRACIPVARTHFTPRVSSFQLSGRERTIQAPHDISDGRPGHGRGPAPGWIQRPSPREHRRRPPQDASDESRSAHELSSSSRSVRDRVMTGRSFRRADPASGIVHVARSCVTERVFFCSEVPAMPSVSRRISMLLPTSACKPLSAVICCAHGIELKRQSFCQRSLCSSSAARTRPKRPHHVSGIRMFFF